MNQVVPTLNPSSRDAFATLDVWFRSKYSSVCLMASSVATKGVCPLLTPVTPPVLSNLSTSRWKALRWGTACLLVTLKFVMNWRRNWKKYLILCQFLKFLWRLENHAHICFWYIPLLFCTCVGVLVPAFRISQISWSFLNGVSKRRERFVGDLPMVRKKISKNTKLTSVTSNGGTAKTSGIFL